MDAGQPPVWFPERASTSPRASTTCSTHDHVHGRVRLVVTEVALVWFNFKLLQEARDKALPHGNHKLEMI